MSKKERKRFKTISICEDLHTEIYAEKEKRGILFGKFIKIIFEEWKERETKKNNWFYHSEI